MAEWADQPGPGGVPGPAIQAGNGRNALPVMSEADSAARPFAEQAESADGEHESARDGLRSEGSRGGAATEERQDHSAGDLLREAAFDPVQDDAGPEKG